MTTSDRGWGWQIGLASWLAMGFAIATCGDCALAQIIPDGTLGTESSVVTPQAPGSTVDVISGGATRGASLFHSFEEFSVTTGGAAFFSNGLEIQNIISRVTGESISNIDGLIRANGAANLFLLNPNGIIFGPNARLDIGGSILASTAHSVSFADGTQFSATAPQTTPLLTVSVPLGLQFGSNPGKIQVQGNGQGLRATSDLIDTTVGLRVQPDETLAMVGGTVALEGGTLKTAGGRIELGSVAGSGLVNLTSIDSGWALGYTGVPNFGDIQLSSAAAVDASGEGSGDIQVWGRRVTLQDGSQIEASTLGLEPGGKLNVTAKESVELIGGSADSNFRSGLFTDVYEGATGSGSNLTIETGKLIVRDGARVSTTTLGSGQGGNLTVTASESVELIGMSADNQVPGGVFVDPFDPNSDTSGLFTRTLGAGSAGNLTIVTENLTVRDGAAVAADTGGEGRGGNLTVKAPDSVEVIGFNSFLTTETHGAGAAGDLTIETGKLFVRNVAFVSTETWDEGPGGRLEVSAAESVELTDIGILSTSSLGLDGSAGDLTITTGKLLVQNASAVTASTLGAGRGGNLTVTARESVELSSNKTNSGATGLSTNTAGTGAGGDVTISTGKLIVQNGAEIASETFDSGQAGNITVTASDSVELSSQPGFSASSLSTDNSRNIFPVLDSTSKQVGTDIQGGIGAAGNVTISTGRLIVQNGARVSASTASPEKEGLGGSLTVNAKESINLSGTSDDGKFASGLFTQTTGGADAGKLTIATGRLTVRDGAQISAVTTGEIPTFALQKAGNGGSITVDTNTFEAANGGQVLTTTEGSGGAGNITLTVPNRVTLEGYNSGLFANTTLGSIGQGGNLKISTGQLIVRDGAEASVSSEGSGNAGELRVEADSIALDNQGKLRASTASGSGGNIELQVQDLILMRLNSLISAKADNNGNGGNITINAPFIVAVPGENSDIIANAVRGQGGNINITTQGVYGLEYRPQLTPKSDINASSDFGVNGAVQINTPDVDPSRGLVNLPAELVDASNQIAQSCPSGVRQGESKFVITGRGGLPPNPSVALSSDAIQVDWVTLNPGVENRSSPPVSTNPTAPDPDPIVEAQGWVINNKGEVVLTATAPTPTPRIPWLTAVSCHAPETSS